MTCSQQVHWRLKIVAPDVKDELLRLIPSFFAFRQVGDQAKGDQKFTHNDGPE